MPASHTDNSLLEHTVSIDSLNSVNIVEIKERIIEHGIVLFKPRHLDEDSLARFAKTLCNSMYERNFYESRLGPSTGGIFGVDSGNGSIPVHAENSFFPPARPDIGFLWIKTPCATGGKTTFIDGCRLFSQLPTALGDLLSSSKFVWHVHFAYTALKQFYGIENAEQFSNTLLPKLLRDPGSREFILVSVIPREETIEMLFEVPIVHRSKRGFAISTNFSYLTKQEDMSQHRRWALLSSKDCDLTSVFAEIAKILPTIRLAPDWQANDLLVFDNWTVMHGRQKFEQGLPRDIRTVWCEASWIRPQATILKVLKI
jgi:alpha-ketoglutarate-dependent taurine dioxygenase